MASKDWSQVQINTRFKDFMKWFYSSSSPQTYTEEKLVELVATRTRVLKDKILAADIPLDQAANDSGRKVIVLLSGIKKVLYAHTVSAFMSREVFADFVSQVLMFSLLYAHRVLCTSSDPPSEKEKKIKAYVTDNMANGGAMEPFRNLMRYVLDNRAACPFIGEWIDECTEFLSFVQMSGTPNSNPDYHRLFELFLEKYDAQIRFDYGAYYTP